MKLYVVNYGGNISNKLNNIEKKEKKYTMLVSDEGLYIGEGRSLKRMVIHEGEHTDMEEGGVKLKLDSSRVELVECNRVPFKYSKMEINEVRYKLADGVELVIQNDYVQYYEFEDECSVKEVRDMINIYSIK